MGEGFIPAHGGYKDLLSYQKALIVYDATYCFCERFMDKRDRTVDQMIQGARSGKQNILEGSQASGTSKETELKLVNVARSSLEELLEDYRDFLRTPASSCGTRIAKKRRMSANSARRKIGPMRPTGPISRRARRKWSPTSWSALSTRPTTFSISKSASSRKRSSKKAASVNE